MYISLQVKVNVVTILKARRLQPSPHRDESNFHIFFFNLNRKDPDISELLWSPANGHWKIVLPGC